MHIEFQYTLEDLKEVQQVGLRNQRQPRNFKRGILGWFLFIGLVLMMVFLLNRQQPPPSSPAVVPTPAPQTSPLTSILVPMVPWLVLVAILWFVIFRQLRGKWLKNNPLLMKPVSMEIDDQGLFCSDGPTQTRHAWAAFDKVVESADRFFLRLHSGNQFVMIPKRALAGPVAIEQVRKLLGHVPEGTSGAFPVIPLRVQQPSDG